MKKYLAIALIALFVVGGAAWYFTVFKLDSVIRQKMEEAGSNTFGTPVTVGSLETDLKNGSLTISNITVANPPGYNNKYALSLSGIEAAVDYQSLEIKRVIIERPEIIIEERNGETNFSEMLANMERSPTEEEPAPGGEEPPVIVIHHFRMNESRAAFESKSLDRYTELEVDEVELRNIRGTPAVVSKAIASEIVEEVVSEAAKEMLKAKASEKLGELFN